VAPVGEHYARRPVRVLCVGNTYPPQAPGGGYELTWRSFVTHLRDRGHAVRVLTSVHREPGVDTPDDPEVYRELPWYWRHHVFLTLPWRERIAVERNAASLLESHIEEFEPDAVNWWGMGGMSLGLVERVRRAEIPAVGVVGDEWMVWGPRTDGWLQAMRRLHFAAPIAGRLTGLPAKVNLADAAVWLYNSHWVMRQSGVPGRVEHPGIDNALFTEVSPREWSWRLLYLGRIDESKGVHVAMDALRHLPADATLTLQGRGDPAYVATLPSSPRVTFTNEPRERLRDVYAEHDAVLFPAQWEEPWGLVPLEAMAVGRPVVASGTGGSAEYLRHEENALIYSPRDSAAALADAVKRLADDADLRARVRQGGLPTAAKFSERRYNEAIERALEEAVRARRE
jgi:glycosyltransferase involved in cell wall biosynthesis